MMWTITQFQVTCNLFVPIRQVLVNHHNHASDIIYATGLAIECCGCVLSGGLKASSSVHRPGYSRHGGDPVHSLVQNTSCHASEPFVLAAFLWRQFPSNSYLQIRERRHLWHDYGDGESPLFRQTTVQYIQRRQVNSRHGSAHNDCSA